MPCASRDTLSPLAFPASPAIATTLIKAHSPYPLRRRYRPIVADSDCRAFPNSRPIRPSIRVPIMSGLSLNLSRLRVAVLGLALGVSPVGTRARGASCAACRGSRRRARLRHRLCRRGQFKRRVSGFSPAKFAEGQGRPTCARKRRLWRSIALGRRGFGGMCRSPPSIATFRLLIAGRPTSRKPLPSHASKSRCRSTAVPTHWSAMPRTQPGLRSGADEPT